MTASYAAQLANLDRVRRQVTKELLGFGADGDQLSAATLEAHLREASRRIAESRA